MEHLGDAVAGRYVLVAPACPRAARRQYHAVDLRLDRTVMVRFEPRDLYDGRRRRAHHTADGCPVIDHGDFAGSAFVVVVAGSAGATGPYGAGVELAELEALIAAPCAAGPRSRRTRRRPGLALGVVALVVVLGAAALIAVVLGGAEPPAVHPPPVTRDQIVQVSAGR